MKSKTRGVLVAVLTVRDIDLRDAPAALQRAVGKRHPAGAMLFVDMEGDSEIGEQRQSDVAKLKVLTMLMGTPVNVGTRSPLEKKDLQEFEVLQDLILRCLAAADGILQRAGFKRICSRQDMVTPHAVIHSERESRPGAIVERFAAQGRRRVDNTS
ncbi:unnamed protein product [Symbiodinium sp. CCMP2592]|nr:unnamed protein product [Symbiodinium sp. CCMP2592]